MLRTRPTARPPLAQRRSACRTSTSRSWSTPSCWTVSIAPAPSCSSSAVPRRGLAILSESLPELVLASANDPDRFPDRVDLAVSIGWLEQLAAAEVERWVSRLHDLGAPALYSLDRESESLRAALGRYYWLRDLWVDDRQGRRPDPTRRPVGHETGRYRHLVGRRRLVPRSESAGLG